MTKAPASRWFIAGRGENVKRRKIIVERVNNVDLEERISPHFTLAEMTRTDVKMFIDQNRELTGSVRANLEALCKEILEPIRHKMGPVIIHSAYRCPELNAYIGGSRTSDHMDGNAADFHVLAWEDKWGLKHTIREIINMGLPFGQLILEPFWVHVSRITIKNQGVLLRYDGCKYTPLVPGEL